MTQPASPRAAEAEALLERHFARLRSPTKYIASFRTKRGRHLGLTRSAKGDIYLWAECLDPSLTGVTVKNRDVPGQPYGPEQPRSSNITTASKRLGLGNPAYYLQFESLAALDRFAGWYDTV